MRSHIHSLASGHLEAIRGIIYGQSEVTTQKCRFQKNTSWLLELKGPRMAFSAVTRATNKAFGRVLTLQSRQVVMSFSFGILKEAMLMLRGTCNEKFQGILWIVSLDLHSMWSKEKVYTYCVSQNERKLLESAIYPKWSFSYMVVLKVLLNNSSPTQQ